VASLLLSVIPFMRRNFFAGRAWKFPTPAFPFLPPCFSIKCPPLGCVPPIEGSICVRHFEFSLSSWSTELLRLQQSNTLHTFLPPFSGPLCVPPSFFLRGGHHFIGPCPASTHNSDTSPRHSFAFRGSQLERGRVFHFDRGYGGLRFLPAPCLPARQSTLLKWIFSQSSLFPDEWKRLAGAQTPFWCSAARATPAGPGPRFCPSPLMFCHPFLHRGEF